MYERRGCRRKRKKKEEGKKEEAGICHPSVAMHITLLWDMTQCSLVEGICHSPPPLIFGL
jgi:hypothetical protein